MLRPFFDEEVPQNAEREGHFACPDSQCGSISKILTLFCFQETAVNIRVEGCSKFTDGNAAEIDSVSVEAVLFIYTFRETVQ
jgi:hypothetical protein